MTGCASLDIQQSTAPLPEAPATLPVAQVDSTAEPQAAKEALAPEAKSIGSGNKPLAEVRAPVVLAPGDKHADLLDRIKAGFGMPELDTALVATHERWYLARPEYMQRVFERGGKYLYHITVELEKRGMPTELALLPIVESAFNPRAMSPAQAAGLWQFIPSTGKQYNLRQNWWADQRRDVIDSTDAALEYLTRIYEFHNRDWFLALASYNWGEGNVAKAVKKNAARNRSTAYEALDMPQETRHYVPKLIALRNVLRNNDIRALGIAPIPNKPYFVALEKTRSIDLKLAAKFAGLSVEEFLALNPAHNRPIIAASRHNRIVIPIEREQEFLAKVESYTARKKPLATWRPYTLKKGESLHTVAEKTDTTVEELQDANGLRVRGKVIDGTTLLAPIVTSADDAPVVESALAGFSAPRLVEQVQTGPAYHRVGKKESLASIADRYDISVAVLKAWNGIKSNVRKGTRLMVGKGGTQTIVTDENGQRQVLARHSTGPDEEEGGIRNAAYTAQNARIGDEQANPAIKRAVLSTQAATPATKKRSGSTAIKRAKSVRTNKKR